MSKRILIIIGPEYHDTEVFYPIYRFTEEGYEVIIAGIGEKQYNGKFNTTIQVDGNIKDYDADDFDAVILPGGWAPDKIRMCKEALDFVKEMDKKNKVVAAICHGPWVFASAGILSGRKLTCYKAIKDDVANAGANYYDEIVVVDKNMVTSRKPNDLPFFCKEIIRLLK